MLKNYITVIMGNGFSRGIALLTFVIIARQLTVVEFGVYSLLVTVMMFTADMITPIDNLYVSQSGNKDSARDSIIVYYKIKIVYVCFIVLTGILISYIVATCLIKDRLTTPYVYLFLVSGALMTILSCYASLHQSNNNFTKFTIVSSIYNLMIFFVLVAFYLSEINISVKSLSYIYFASVLLYSIICSVMINSTAVLKASYADAFLKISKYKSLLMSSLVRLLSNRIDLFIIANLLTLTDVARYSAAARVPTISMLFIGNIMSISIVRSSKAIESKCEFRKYMKENVMVYFIISFIVLAMIVFSKQILGLIAGSKYVDCYYVSNILLLQALTTGVSAPFTSLLYSMRLTRQILYLELIKIMYSIMIIVVLLRVYGLIGGAVGMLISATINMILIIYSSNINLNKQITN